MTLADVLPRLRGVRRAGDGWTALCPAHEDGRASLSLREVGGKTLVHCFAGCTFDAIRGALGLTFPRAQILHYDGEVNVTDAERARRNGALALRIWRESRAAAGTLVETYLRARGITIAPPPSLRFYPRLRHPSGVTAPAMVAAVQSDTEIVAIHRTFLRADGGGKANLEPQKAMLGPSRGGAIRFAKAAQTIAIAEGVETSLSIAQACPNLPTWSALSAGGIERLRLPDLVRTVVICADGDEAGERAAQIAARRWLSEGRAVSIARPAAQKDWNDELRA